MLTKGDIKKIDTLIQSAITKNNKVLTDQIFLKMFENFATKQDLLDLKEQVVTKEEFYKEIFFLKDEIACIRKELNTEHRILCYHVEQNTQDIIEIKKKLKL